MVIFDVKSLFTKAPIEDFLHIIKERLEADDTLEIRTTLSVQQICQLTELCQRSTYFQYEDLIYEQSDGMAMGSPLSPVVASREKQQNLLPRCSSGENQVLYLYLCIQETHSHGQIS